MNNIPSLVEIDDAFIANIEGQFGVSISDNSKAFLRALSATESAEMKLLYLILGFLQQNIAPDLAQSESVGGMLERYGRIRLGRNPFGAIAGSFNVRVSGTIGAIINGQVTFKSDDSSKNPGNLYILDEPFTLVTGSDVITLRSLTTGTAGSLNIGDTLTPTSPIALVNSSVMVTAVSIQPLDAEALETYRSELLNTYRLSPQGGAATDYRLWSQDAQGVAQVYPYAASGYSNRVNLFIEAIPSDSIDGKGTPSAGMLAAVQAVVEFNPDTTLPILERGRRPITVIVNYLPVTVKQIDISIPSFVGITPAIEALILSAMTSYISLIRPFVAAADVISEKNDIIDINGIINTILSVVPGSSFGSIVLNVNGSPLNSYQFTQGDIPFLNSINY